MSRAMGVLVWSKFTGAARLLWCHVQAKCFGVASSPGSNFRFAVFFSDNVMASQSTVLRRAWDNQAEREGFMDASLSARLLFSGLASTKGKCNTNEIWSPTFAAAGPKVKFSPAHSLDGKTRAGTIHGIDSSYSV